MKPRILASSSITSKATLFNGQIVLKNDQNKVFSQYARDIYNKLDPHYPKFFKMDELCQLAFLSTEILTNNMDDWDGNKIAIVLGNKNSSITSDMRHYKAIADKKDYFPSPAVFVYTLPNIMLGEICIRHKITGENSCFMMDELDADFLRQYVNYLFEKEKYRHCITGFVDFTAESYIARLFLIGKSGAVHASLDLDFDKNFNKIIP